MIFKNWDLKEKELDTQNQFKVEIIEPSKRERNFEKLLKWQMIHHKSGTVYSEEYLSQIRKIRNSKNCTIGCKN